MRTKTDIEAKTVEEEKRRLEEEKASLQAMREDIELQREEIEKEKQSVLLLKQEVDAARDAEKKKLANNVEQTSQMKDMLQERVSNTVARQGSTSSHSSGNRSWCTGALVGGSCGLLI